jgi:ArsR family transcriptional regulator, arsenate/arsenite/antimonite-responsive transcriptional repressor
MAFSKQHLYRPETQIPSGFFKALGFPGRLEILFKLYAEGPLCVLDLIPGHPISRETLSGHLKILRAAQMIDATERFPYTFYQINEKNMAKAEEALTQFFFQLKQSRRQL